MIRPIVHRTLTVIQHLIPDKSPLYNLEWICPKQLQEENNILIEDPFLTDGAWLKSYKKELVKTVKTIPTMVCRPRRNHKTWSSVKTLV